jgi:hypothetical protein
MWKYKYNFVLLSLDVGLRGVVSFALQLHSPRKKSRSHLLEGQVCSKPGLKAEVKRTDKSAGNRTPQPVTLFNVLLQII